MRLTKSERLFHFVDSQLEERSRYWYNDGKRCYYYDSKRKMIGYLIILAEPGAFPYSITVLSKPVTPPKWHKLISF